MAADSLASRWRALAAAGHTGDVELARGALDDPDPATRELALGAIDRLAETGAVLRRHDAYDHSYWFIQTFIEDHLKWHAERLRA